MKLIRFFRAFSTFAFLSAFISATASCQVPTAKEIESQIFVPTGLQSLTEPLIKVLKPEEKARLGKLTMAGAADSKQAAANCGGNETVRLAYSVHTSGSTVIYLCRDGVMMMTDFMTVVGFYPALLEKMPSAMIQMGGGPPTAYIRLLLSAELRSKRANKGAIKFPLSYCNPYSFLHLYLFDPDKLDPSKPDPFKMDPTTVDCSSSDVAADRAEVIKLAGTSQIMAFSAQMGKAMGPSEDESDPIAGQFLLYIGTSILQVIAHEVAHSICNEPGSACEDEAHIDSLALSLLLRANNGDPSSIFILTASQYTLLFSSIFNDSEPIYEQSLEKMMKSQELAKRSSQAACSTVSALDDFIQKNPDTVAKIEAAGKANPFMQAVTENHLAAFRAYMSTQCVLGGK